MHLLSLILLLKNEARSVGTVIASALPHIDHCLILDTGSTDGTQDLARAALGDLPHEIMEEPFVDFSTSRNRLLDLLGDRAVFSLTLDADETLIEGAALRRFCEEHHDAPHGAYSVEIEFGRLRYGSPRLLRSSARWRWVGAVHEIPVSPTGEAAGPRVPGCSIHHDTAQKDMGRTAQRWRTVDLPLLRRAVQERPRDARAWFYLGQTLHCLGQYGEAMEAYQERVRLGGWLEEQYEAAYRIGRCLEALGMPAGEVLEAHLRAHDLAPHRAEPLIDLALAAYRREEWGTCYLLARRACEIAYPAGAQLFVDRLYYDFTRWDLLGISAWYVGEFAVGEAACRRALESDPGAAHVLANLALYEGRRS